MAFLQLVFLELLITILQVPTILCGLIRAVNTVVEALDRVRDTAGSHGRVLVVEVMGRDAEISLFGVD